MKDYLGDAVYAEYLSGGTLVLSTGADLANAPGDVIYLEPEVQLALDRFRHRAAKEGLIP